jgi:hypothetical protein
MSAYDYKPDRKLDLDEFNRLVQDVEKGHVRSSRSAPTRATVPSSREVDDVFARFDRNRSGYLDYRELRNALQYYGLDVSSRGAQQVLAAYDDHPDGKLEKAEFAELVRDIESGATHTGSARAGSQQPSFTGHHGRDAHGLAALALNNGSMQPFVLDSMLNGTSSQQPIVVDMSGMMASGQTPVGQQYAAFKSGRWSRDRRSQEAAKMRNLDRELRDEAIREDMLADELENEERDEAEREDELTQQLIDELEAEILDEEAAADELLEQIDLEDDPYEAFLQHGGYGFGGGYGHGYSGPGEPAYAHGVAVRYDDDDDDDDDDDFGDYDVVRLPCAPCHCCVLPGMRAAVEPAATPPRSMNRAAGS